ncbi:diguanylate cyclase [Roseisolibacter sp. H3M3-2]|uniref:diguanylate cyclase domain-containing protein n=1 Tax=Roseisolibacter sp. H3M3-2 TaxID=3031323 RepID=UPI0023DC13AB|nr:diguanylate cyclase [Roseisolibacter sp. H3M3-2]MDF1501583.1 diguanylate cyclase [Roseisolibacter sp. H3M3-2]
MPSGSHLRGRAARALLAAACVVGPAAARAQLPTPDIPAEDTALVGAGSPIVVAGRAVVGSGVLHDRSLMIALDRGAAGGVWVFSRGAAAVRVAPGDSVEATGVLHRYRGTTEVVASSVRRIAVPARALTSPESSPPSSEAAVAAEGRLIRMRGVAGAQGSSEGGRWLRLRLAAGEGALAAADSVTVWVPATHQRDPGITDLRVGDDVEVTGIAAVYRDNPTDAPIAQLIPRGPDDVRVHGIPGRWRELALRGLLGALAAAGLGWALVHAATRRQARALRETEARYRQLLELSPDAVLVHADDHILFANPAAARLLALPDERSLAGVPLARFLDADERAALAVAATAARRVRTRLRAADGATLDVEAATSPCRYSDRDAAVIVARDIGPQLRYERELRELALLDELTGLHNRRGFLTFAEAELRRLRATGQGAVLLFADLDGLKRINDAHGHAAGDAALVAVARALREVVGAQGLVERARGDEFAALVHEPAPGEAAADAAIAETIERRLADAMARRRNPLEDWTPSATVGAHRLPPDGGEPLVAALAAAAAGLDRLRAVARPLGLV